MTNEERNNLIRDCFQLGTQYGYQVCITDIICKIESKVRELDNTHTLGEIAIGAINEANSESRAKEFSCEKIIGELIDISDKYFSYFGG